MNTDNIIIYANDYYNQCMLLSKGKKNNKKSLKKKLKQLSFDNNSSDDKSVIDLTDADEFAYSAIMRKLRQKASKEQVLIFLKIFKLQFDQAVKKKLQKPEKVALQNALIRFNKLVKIKLDKKLIKNAAVSELGTPEQIGKYLSDIVKFTIARMPLEKRPTALNRIKQKFNVMHESEIASKNLPDSAAIGQSITFVKHVLFNHNPQFIREVLNNLVRNL